MMWYYKTNLKLILLDSKPRKESLVLTLSSALIVKANTKQIVIFVYSRSIISTENDILSYTSPPVQKTTSPR